MNEYLPSLSWVCESHPNKAWSGCQCGDQQPMQSDGRPRRAGYQRYKMNYKNRESNNGRYADGQGYEERLAHYFSGRTPFNFFAVLALSTAQ